VKVTNQLRTVILSEAKNLVAIDSLDIIRTPRVHARDEILRFAQNDRVKRALLHPTREAWHPHYQPLTESNSSCGSVETLMPTIAAPRFLLTSARIAGSL
jgi:hypothetical protein